MGFRYATGRLYKPRAGGYPTGTWWLSGGIAAANCLAAYQPVGAPSKASSWTNHANPGTYTASEGNGTVGWGASTGWYIDSSGDRIATGVPIAAQSNPNYTYSVFARIKTLSQGHGTTFGRLFEVDSDNDFTCAPYTSNASISPLFQYGNQSGGTIASNIDGTIGFAGLKAYVNNVNILTIGLGASVNGGSLNIGNRADNARTMDGYIYAFAVYDVVITEAQIGALHTAMNAL